MTDETANTEVSSDPMITAEERSIYPLALYAALFPVAWTIARHLAPEPIAAAAVTFVGVLGSWWVDKGKRQKISFAAWVGISVLAAVASFGLMVALLRLWPES